MDIKILNKSDNKIKLLLKNFDLALVNSLRRICDQEVKTIAIEDVDFYPGYTGVLPMEIIAHRLGLIPLKSSDLRKNKDFSDQILTLDVKADKDGYIVYSKDLKSDNVKPVYDNMPIIKLNKNQSIKIRARACWNNGLEHDKWSPVCPVTFYEESESGKSFGDFIFVIETSGSLEPEEVFEDALTILYQNLENFIEKI